MRGSCLLSLLAAVCFGGAHAAGSEATSNPIRKVVSLLQAMQKKVEEEGEKEKKLFDTFMCWCKNGNGDLSASVSAANDKIPQVSSNIDAAEGKLAQTKEDLKSAQEDRSAADRAMKEAVALREKEAAAFAAEKAEADTNIAAMEKAIAALERGMAGGFLQTPTAQVLRKLAQNSQDIIDADRQDLIAFLSGASKYAPQSGAITGILKEMHETMSKNLADATATEEASIKSHEELIAAKTKEVAALTESIEVKNTQIGELGVQIVEMKEDLDDTQNALAADQKYFAELEKSCATKATEWDERSKTRAEELVALADTIKVLNDDDALQLFKATLPSPSSFVQFATKSSTQRTRALEALRGAKNVANPSDRAGLDLLMLALSGKKSQSQGAFDKVIKMCDEMVEVLKKEQDDDDHKKEYCGAQFDLSDDSKKKLEREVSDHDNAIATAKESIATLTEEIAALEAGIKKLDKAVAEATEQRQSENVEFKALMASDTAAKEVLAFAKNRLNKFYSPKLFKEAPKVELSAQGRIEASISGTEPPTAAPGGIADTGISVAFVQLSAHRDAPAPPPETWNAYAKKSEESTGVIAMIDLLIKDLDKEMTEATTEEKEAQEDYEVMMKESAEKRVADSTALTAKGAAKADMEAQLQSHEEGKTAAVKEHMATMEYIASLHAECDWLLQYFDVRKEARAGEIDSIMKAKAVLSGADYSLVQTRAHRFLRGA